MEDGDSDAEMAAGAADYRADFSDDVDPNFDAKARPQQGPAVEIHKGIGNRTPPPGAFSRFGGPGGFKFPDSRFNLKFPIGRPGESGNRESPFPDSAGNRESGSAKKPTQQGGYVETKQPTYPREGRCVAAWRSPIRVVAHCFQGQTTLSVKVAW